MTPENVKTFTPLENILQMLCRTFQTLRNTGIQSLVASGVLMGGQAWAQTTPANPGWSALEQGAKQFVVDTYKVEAPTVSILPMDHRIKIEACSQDILFDQPFGNKQSVRARCAQPVWQHFVMVQMRTGLGANRSSSRNTACQR